MDHGGGGGGGWAPGDAGGTAAAGGGGGTIGHGVSSVLITLVVVALAIAVAMRTVLSELPKPATAKAASARRGRDLALDMGPRVMTALPGASGRHDIGLDPTQELELDIVRWRGAPMSAAELALPLRWWERLRSGATLAVLLGLLGVTSAALVALMLVVVVMTLRRAVGP